MSKLQLIFCILLQAYSMHANAVGVCESNKSDIAEDMQKINEKLAVKYGSLDFQKARHIQTNDAMLEKIYDEQELKVDRSMPFLKQVNSVGIVTDGSASSPISYGTAVLISPCHVLINAHAIVDQKTKNGQSPILISLGQNTCDSPDAFLHQDIKGQVIASGNADDPSSDYAIVRIPKLTDIEPALIATEYLNRSYSFMSVGFPFKSTFSKKTGFRYATVNFSRAYSLNVDGTFRILNKSDSAGGSGSGVFILDDDNGRPQVVLGGIHRGQEGVGLQTAVILEDLKANNTLVYQELGTAISNKTCK